MSDRIELRCPGCNRLLCKAIMADIEIACTCKRLVTFKVYSAKSLLLTSEQKSVIIESKQRSK